MRTKKAIVHGRHSRKRNYVSGSSNSKRNGLPKKRLVRTVTQKRGGAKFLGILGRKSSDKTNCLVSGDRFKNSECFSKELNKLLGNAIAEYLEKDVKFYDNPDQSEGAKTYYNEEAKKLFTKIKRALFPFLVNVMEMRQDGELLSDVQWDDGYNTLIMLIILRNIDSTVYQSLIDNQGYITPELSADFSKLDKKKEKECMEQLKCLELSPSSISQILTFYFLQGISETEADSEFIKLLKKLVDEKKIKLQSGGTALYLWVSKQLENRKAKKAQLEAQPGVGQPATPQPEAPVAQPEAQPEVAQSGVVQPEAQPEVAQSGVVQPEVAQPVAQSGVVQPEVAQPEAPSVTPVTPQTTSSAEIKIQDDHFKRFYEMLFGNSSNDKPQKLVDELRKENYSFLGTDAQTVDKEVTLFSLCKNIFKNFIDNETFDFNSDGQLSHREHLLCVGEMPEYMSEFDVPTQFRSKSSKISDLEWPEAEFKKLKLVVFLKPNEEIVSGQKGGAEGQDQAHDQAQVHSSVLGRKPEELPEELPAVELPAEELPADPSVQPEVKSAPSAESVAQQEAQPSVQSVTPSETQSDAPSDAPSEVTSAELVAQQEAQQESKQEAPKTSVTGNTYQEVHRIFSIYQRTDNKPLKLDKLCKEGEYFVKYRVPALRLNITKKTGILPGTRTELSTEEGKRMSFSYPVRFGPDFPKYVNLMLNESSYYKQLEEGAENLAHLVSKYQQYEKFQKTCEPNILHIQEPGNCDRRSTSGFVNPAYNPASNRPGLIPNPAYRPSSDETERLSDMLKEILAKQEGTLDDKAMRHMIYELIYSLKLSKSESGGLPERRDLEQENRGLREELEAVTAKLAEVKTQNAETISALEQQIEALRKTQAPEAETSAGSVEELRRSNEDLETKVRKLEAQVEKLTGENVELKQQLGSLTSDLEKQLQENRKLIEQITQLEANIDRLTQASGAEIADIEAQKQRLNEELARIKSEKDALDTSNAELTERLTQVQRDLEAQTASAAQKLAAAKADCEKTKIALANAEARIKELESALEKLQGSGGGSAPASEQAVFNTAAGEAQTLELSTIAIERIKSQLPDDDTVCYVRIGTSAIYRIDTTQVIKYSRTNNNKYIQEMMNIQPEAKIILLFDENGYLEVEIINTLINTLTLNHKAKYNTIVKNANSGPIIYDPNDKTFKLNFLFYQQKLLEDIYYDTATEFKTTPIVYSSGKEPAQKKHRNKRSINRRRDQSLKFGIGGSRTKKLNKINSRNKSKKINF